MSLADAIENFKVMRQCYCISKGMVDRLEAQRAEFVIGLGAEIQPEVLQRWEAVNVYREACDLLTAAEEDTFKAAVDVANLAGGYDAALFNMDHFYKTRNERPYAYPQLVNAAVSFDLSQVTLRPP